MNPKSDCPKSRKPYSNLAKLRPEEDQPAVARLVERVKKWAAIIAAIFLIVLFVLVLGVALGTMSVAVYDRTVLKPQDPELRIESAVLSDIKVTGGTQRTARWDLTVVFVNPNQKLPIKFRTLQVILFYLCAGSPDSLMSSIVWAAMPVAAPPLLNHSDQSSVHFQLATAENAYVSSETGDQISDTMARGGSLFFGVKVMSFWMFDNDRLEQKDYWLVKISGSLEFEFHVSNGSWTTRWPGIGTRKFDFDDKYPIRHYP